MHRPDWVTTGGFLGQKTQNASPSVACRRPLKREAFVRVCLIDAHTAKNSKNINIKNNK
jgi:hypothetical protein